MKKIIALSIAAIVIIVVAGAGTFAFFSDVGNSTGNYIQSGKLQLSLGSSQSYTLYTMGSAVPSLPGTLTNRTGTATGAPLYLSYGANTGIAATAGTYSLSMPAYVAASTISYSGTSVTPTSIAATATVTSTTLTTVGSGNLSITLNPGYAASNGATLTTSPQNLSTGSNTINITTLGSGTVNIYLPTGVSGLITSTNVQNNPVQLNSGSNTVTVTSGLSFVVNVYSPNDNVVSLTNSSSSTIPGLLDIKLGNIWQDGSGFPGYHYLSGSTLNTVASGVGNAGDLGKAESVAIWLSTSPTALQNYDVELKPGGDWIVLGSSPSLTYYNWTGNTSGGTGNGSYISSTSTPTSSGSALSGTWYGVTIPNGANTTGTPTIAAGNTYYLHITHYIPENHADSQTNNAIQGVKLYTDYTFTLRQQ